jgi:hypothetical protein
MEIERCQSMYVSLRTEVCADKFEAYCLRKYYDVCLYFQRLAKNGYAMKNAFSRFFFGS